jgi:hypothetical protein
MSASLTFFIVLGIQLAIGVYQLLRIFLILVVLAIVLIIINRKKRNRFFREAETGNTRENLIELRCPICKTVVRSKDKFCQSCGNKL